MKLTTDDKPLRDSAILAAVALAVGIYLAAAAVVISEDGVTYIERARRLAAEPDTVFNLKEPPGLPILIYGLHSFFGLFTRRDTPALWIASGQAISLVFRVLTIVVLYCLGRRLLDRRSAFWGGLILIVLPYPAYFGSDVLRDWPHLFFLTAGLLLLYEAVRREKGLLFFLAGLASGLGYVIRPEGAQVMLYGAVFFAVHLVTALRHKRPAGRWRVYLWLAAGFLVIFFILAWLRQDMIPQKLHMLFKPKPVRPAAGGAVSLLQAGFGPADWVSAAVNLVQGLFENMLYYFLVPAVIGFYLLFFKRPADLQRQLLIGLVFGFYITALCLLDMRWGYISRRHLLPMTALLCLYIPSGCDWLAQRLFAKNRTVAFYVLILAGMLSCLPKLFTPMGIDKRPLRQAANWIASHTPAEAVFYTYDNRVPFYAQRDYQLYRRAKVNRKAADFRYWIVLSKDGQPGLTIPPAMRLEQRFELESDKELQIYRRTDY
jgi:4-amino-4-deoxy-L-arabinose transferase-like glycosyltransferase